MKTGYATPQSGNILFAILIAIALMGALTIVMSDGFSGAKGISDTEMDAKVNKILAYSQSVKDAVELVYSKDGVSETDFLFAHTKNHSFYGDDVTVSPSLQVFGVEGGGAHFMWPIPEGINDGTPWEINGQAVAPQVGTSTGPNSQKVDLLLVLPFVTYEFCKAVNRTLGYKDSDPIPTIYNGCGLNNSAYRWDNSYPSGHTAANTMDNGAEDWVHLPAYYGCARCTNSPPTTYHYFYTLLAR